jgi:hypothetical protein
MARQQIEIIDESPMVQYKSGNPAAAGGAYGALPAGRVPLPKAGLQQYSQSSPGFSGALPQVYNGVPKTPPAPAKTSSSPSGLSGKAGSLKPTKTTTAKQPATNTVKTYNAYKGYGGSTPSGATGSAYGASQTQVQTNVSGSLLHWQKRKKGL